MLRPALVALCAATIATGAMGQSTGIAVCDELFGKWEACLTKMPDFDRKIQKSVLDELHAHLQPAHGHDTHRLPPSAPVVEE